MKIKNRFFLICLLVMMSLFAAVPAQAKTASVVLTLKSKPGTRPYYLKKGTKVQLKGKVGKKKYSGTKLKYVSSNTKVATVSAKGIVKAKKSGQTVIRVFTKDGKYGAKVRLKVTKKSLTIAQRAMNYKSSTKYKILLNRGKHKVYIFKKNSKGVWKRIKTFPCVVGAPGTETPRGVYSTKDKGMAFETEHGNYCWYFTRIYSNYLFHSQIYSPGSMTNIVDGSMGVSVSHGCVRLYLSHAKWIYKNIPTGTRVVIYN